MRKITAEMNAQISAIRAFNRFYVRRIGLLDGGLLKGSYSLTQMHILYDLANNENLTASKIGRELKLDLGYLSRILKKFEEQNLITRTPSKEDNRQVVLNMTKKGHAMFEPLDMRARERNADMLSSLSDESRRKLTSSMGNIQSILDDSTNSGEPYLLRTHEPGDIGWITHRHGVLYKEEHDFDETFEAMVATILAHFVTSYDPKSERSWIAERDGEIVGSIFCIKQSDKVAMLRAFFVEPTARGDGIGSRLVNECIRFARSKKYSMLTLRTSDTLCSAKKIYEEAGFILSSERAVHQFGRDFMDQDWNLQL